MHCHNCGKIVEDEWKYCKYCGTKLQMLPDESSKTEPENIKLRQEVEKPSKPIEKPEGKITVGYSYMITLIGIAGLCCYCIAFFVPSITVLWGKVSLYQLCAELQKNSSGASATDYFLILGPLVCVMCQIGGLIWRSQAVYWITGLTGASFAIYLVYTVNSSETRGMAGLDIGFVIWIIAVFLSITAALVIAMMKKTNSQSSNNQTGLGH